MPKPDPLKERRDYGENGMDALEQNAMALLDKGVKVPMMLEIRLRKRLEKKKAKQDFTIDWIKPKLSKELGEYLENDYTKNFLKSKGKVFNDSKEILAFLKKGKLVFITKNELLKKFKNLTLTKDEFDKELENLEYKVSYESMKRKLTSEKSITLPAPILLKIKDLYYGFAGNRRINLAFNYNIPLKVWLVEIMKVNSEAIIEAVIKRCPKKNQDERPKSEQQWCLFDSKGEKLLGRHPSKEKALAQERVIQIHKHMK